MMKKLFFCLLIGMAFPALSIAQDTPEQDAALLMPVEEVNRFDFLFQRGLFLVNSKNQPDVGQLKNTSGSWYFGLGFKFPIARNRLGVRIQPGFTWLKFNYSQDSSKTYPDAIIHKYQRERFGYVDLPVGLYYNISLDEERNRRFFVEAGGYVRFLVSSMHKFGDEGLPGVDPFKTVETRQTSFDRVEKFQYGLYARGGYRWFALYFSYRLTNIFQTNQSNPNRCNEAGNTPPCLPDLQLGLTILL